MAVRIAGCESIPSFWSLLCDPKAERAETVQRSIRYLEDGSKLNVDAITGVEGFDRCRPITPYPSIYIVIMYYVFSELHSLVGSSLDLRWLFSFFFFFCRTFFGVDKYSADHLDCHVRALAELSWEALHMSGCAALDEISGLHLGVYAAVPPTLFLAPTAHGCRPTVAHQVAGLLQVMGPAVQVVGRECAAVSALEQVLPEFWPIILF